MRIVERGLGKRPLGRGILKFTSSTRHEFQAVLVRLFDERREVRMSEGWGGAKLNLAESEPRLTFDLKISEMLRRRDHAPLAQSPFSFYGSFRFQK